MNILHLTLNRQWFEMIASGDKKEEYREIKPYWENRLYLRDDTSGLDGGHFRNFDIVSANNGYQKNCPNVKWEHKGIRIGEGKPEWGAVPGKQYFILEIGEITKDVPPSQQDTSKRLLNTEKVK